MDIQIQGVIDRIFDEQTGTSKVGNEWRKREFLLSRGGSYPRRILITCFGDRSDILNGYQEGDYVVVSVDLESREYNGRWYTSVNAWRIVRDDTQGVPSYGGNQYPGAPNFEAQPTMTPGSENQFSTDSSEGDDLPF